MTDPARGDSAGLSLPPESMRALTDAMTDSLLARLESVRNDVRWRGATRAKHEKILREPAPEDGQDHVKVLERAMQDIQPVAGRVDHPRFFAFVPSAPAWPGVIA